MSTFRLGRIFNIFPGKFSLFCIPPLVRNCADEAFLERMDHALIHTVWEPAAHVTDVFLNAWVLFDININAKSMCLMGETSGHWQVCVD